ncbi:transposase [Kitasatospora sp. LaBMicrA B282]|uniref:transposase n=1 Tax=Kitasatospora sp. LaBMicrA B282 TaxID=3420949 RepID=UPI003D117DC1
MDLTDAQWELVEPLLPKPNSGPRGGRKEKHPRRRIAAAVLFVRQTGCPWRHLPDEFPPWPTAYWYHRQWDSDGTLERVREALDKQELLNNWPPPW